VVVAAVVIGVETLKMTTSKMKERKLAVAGAQMLQVEVVPGVEEEEMMMICNLQILKEVVTEAVEEVEVTEVDLVVVIVLQ